MRMVIRSAFVSVVIVWIVLSAPVEAKNAGMAEALRYAGVEKASAADVSRMTELWTRAQKPELAGDERIAAFRDLYVFFAKLKGRDVSDRPQTMEGLARWVAGIFDGGGRMDLTPPTPRGKPSGTYVHVGRRGDGPIPLLLISDFGVDGAKLYDSFAQRQEHAYTMHIVTLPFAGAARRLPWPERIDYPARPWMSEIEKELLSIVDRAQMKGITVIGTSAGGYFAARLGLLRPKQVRAVVLVHALVSAPMRSTADPAAPVSLDERRARLHAAPPAPMFFPIAPMPDDKELRRLIADPASTHPSVRNWMAFAVKDAKISEAWTYEALSGGFFLPGAEYGLELQSTDLTPELEQLEIPILAMGSVHDKASPLQTTQTVTQWAEMKTRYPAIPLTVVTFEDARAYLSVECPAEFDRAVADFLAGRKVEGRAMPKAKP
jgi:pimeloyl-ACP methyl ester carboxylesterase